MCSDPVTMQRRRVLGMLGSSALLGCASAGASVADDTSEDDPSESRRRIAVGGSTLEVRSTGVDRLPMAMLSTWVGDAAAMIADYYGGTLPVPGLEITLVAASGDHVGFGQHQDGRWIRVRYGRRASAQTFVDDWVMVHEMLHATFPGLPEGHRWMQEGLSTYLEPIVRARGGATTDAEVWRRWTASMHHGRPGPGDRGLDHTHTWGRTYWGGTLFWLMVDLRLREATAHRRSIRDVVTHIAAQGGNGRVEWTTAQVVEQGDRATGTTVMAQAYAELARAPGDVDLEAVWERLGVQRTDDGLRFDDGAPQAELRRAITQG